MAEPEKNVAIFGSTGSIGRSALEVIRSTPGLNVAALTAHSNVELLSQQVKEFQPDWVVISDADAAAGFDRAILPKDCELLIGADSLVRVASEPRIDIVLAAIVGAAGLASSWAAVESGKTLALANKETLVVAGSLVTSLAAEKGATILPVDSEHSAIFQALAAGNRQDLQRVILTASGGPFLNATEEELKQVTVAQALAHPTWNMGAKITIASATMMNKALEIIEARWLFDLAADQIDAVVHPQSVVHSMVEFVDGSVVAQLSPPDMRLPIQFAFTFPRRAPCVAPRLDLTKSLQLDFFPPDPVRFPAVPLGMEVASAGGTAGVVLNAANEAAVDNFFDGKIAFTDIVPACRAVLDSHTFDPSPTLESLNQLDLWARQEINKWILT